MMTRTFVATNIQANSFQVAAPSELSGAAGTGLGVGYDVVLDCNQNGLLDADDYIDGRNNEAGFYIVHDTAATGPLAVTELTFNLPSAVGSTYGIPATHLGQNVFYPTAIATLGQLPLIVISHGNGHNYQWYDHLGQHLASYGYIVLSHANNTGPGPNSAAITTLGHAEAFINQVAAGAIAGGALSGHLNPAKIVWIGHSRGAEGVAIAYNRIFNTTYVPINFNRSGIRLISSMLPTDFYPADANPRDANYHLWTASGDSDVNGSADCDHCQTYHLHDRAFGNRQSTTVQGTGHAWFHNGGGSSTYFDGPCSIGKATTHKIELGHFLPLIKRYVDDNIPAIDFLTRQYESFRPIGVPTSDSCIVVSHEYYDASPGGTVVLDNYQAGTASTISSSGAAVTFTVTNLNEGRLDDNNSDFSWTGTDSFNGSTQAGPSDASRGVVFDWNGIDRFYEWEVPISERNFTDNLFLSLRGAQGTQHPNTLANLGDLTFTVSLRDASGTSSSIRIDAYGGGGLEKPYARNGGWHNEMETVRLRLSDFLNNNSGLDLGNISAVRLNVGPSWGSSQGRVVIDDLVLSNDRAVYDGSDNGDPHITTVNGINYDFQTVGEFTILRGDDSEVQARQTAVPSQVPIFNSHTGLTSCVSVNTAVAARVGGRRVSYQPGLKQEANPAGMELRVDGQVVNLAGANSVPLGSGGRVSKTTLGDGIEIEFPDGATLRAVPGWWAAQSTWYLNLSVDNTTATEGVMGVIPPGDWLPRLPDGSSLGPRPALLSQRYAVLNGSFAKAWRVSNATSLFDYAGGLNTAAFTDRAWPPENATSCNLPNRRPLPPIEKERAIQACAAIPDPTDRGNCTADVAATGHLGFAKTYIQADRLNRGATRTRVFIDQPIKRDGPVTVVAVVQHSRSGERLKAKDGTVQFRLNGSKLGQPVPLNANGQAILRSRFEDGKAQISADYLPPGGKAVWLPSSSPAVLYRSTLRKDRPPLR
jgi:hypothetical protein